MNEMITLSLSVIILVMTFFMVAIAKREKIIPWGRLPINRMRRLLNMKPHIIKSWVDVEEYYLFMKDRRILLFTSSKISTNTMLFVGNESEYDEFLVTKTIQIRKNVYIVDVDYLGPGSNRQGVELKFTL